MAFFPIKSQRSVTRSPNAPPSLIRFRERGKIHIQFASLLWIASLKFTGTNGYILHRCTRTEMYTRLSIRLLIKCQRLVYRVDKTQHFEQHLDNRERFYWITFDGMKKGTHSSDFGGSFSPYRCWRCLSNYIQSADISQKEANHLLSLDTNGLMFSKWEGKNNDIRDGRTTDISP